MVERSDSMGSSSPLRVIVFGAAGATGRLLVEGALARGHRVTAFVRDPAKLALTHDRLEVVQGDASDAAAVERAAAGHDVAFLATGSGDMKASTVRTDTARVVADALGKVGVRRLIAMSGHGAGESKSALNPVVRLLVAGVFLRHLLRDQNGLEAAVRKSKVEWVLVRPGELQDKPGTGKVRAAADGKGVSIGLPRADVATFMLDQLGSDQWVGQAPSLGVG